MGDEEVGVETGRRAGVEEELLEGDGALRHDAGMLDHQRIAGHQVRTGDAGELIIGEIPRLDAEDHADRARFHVRFTDRRVEFDGRQKTLGVLGIVGENPGAELDFGAGFADTLAHFQGHGVGERVGLFVQQLGGLGDDGAPFGIGLVAPGQKTGLGGGQLGLEFLGGEVFEIPDQFAVKGAEAMVGHYVSPWG